MKRNCFEQIRTKTFSSQYEVAASTNSSSFFFLKMFLLDKTLKYDSVKLRKMFWIALSISAKNIYSKRFCAPSIFLKQFLECFDSLGCLQYWKDFLHQFEWEEKTKYHDKVFVRNMVCSVQKERQWKVFNMLKNFTSAKSLSLKKLAFFGTVSVWSCDDPASLKTWKH